MRRLVPLLLVGALGLAATACDLSPPAVSVNGVTVTRSALDSQLAAVAASPVAQCALSVLAQQNGTTLPTVAGSGTDTVTTGFAAYELTELVRQILEQQGLAQHHATLTAADVAAARTDYRSQLASAAQSSSPCGLTGTNLVDRLPRSFVDQQARALADDEKLEQVAGHVDVSPTAVRAFYQSHLSDVTEECLDLIVATSQATAQTIQAAIAGGTSFATADQGAGVNPNGPPGAQEPCVFPATIASQLGSTLAAAVATLAAGQVAPPQGLSVTDPTTGQASTVWVVVGMRQRQLAPFASVATGIRLQLLQQGQTGLDTALTALAARLHVDLDPRYGTWTTKSGVVAPSAPPASFVLNPTAAGSSPLATPTLGG